MFAERTCERLPQQAHPTRSASSEMKGTPFCRFAARTMLTGYPSIPLRGIEVSQELREAMTPACHSRSDPRRDRTRTRCFPAENSCYATHQSRCAELKNRESARSSILRRARRASSTLSSLMIVARPSQVRCANHAVAGLIPLRGIRDMLEATATGPSNPHQIHGMMLRHSCTTGPEGVEYGTLPEFGR